MKIDKNLLEHLCLIEKLTSDQIADLLGVGSNKVWYWRRKFQIPTLNRTDRYCLPEIQGELKSLLIGSMLGDGGMLKYPRSARYQEGHCPEQLSYLEWKRAIWGEEWAPHPIYERNSFYVREDGVKVFYVSFFTRSHACLNYYYDLFYSFGERNKRFKSEVIELVDPFALAVWYMDDGSAGWWPSLAFGLDIDSKKTCHSILEKFGFNPIWIEGLRGSAGRFEIRGEVAALKFLELVRPYIHLCMEYKLHPKFLESEKRLLDLKVTKQYQVTMHNDRIPIKRAAKELFVSPSAIRRRLNNSGLNYATPIGCPKKFADATLVKKFINLYDENMSISSIARTLGVGRMTVLRFMRSKDIPRGWDQRSVITSL